MSNYDKSGPLDRAIDETVRELMEVDPRPGLRHRVSASIRSQPEHGRRFGTGFAWAAAIAVLVLASVLLLRSPEPDRPAAAPQIATAPAPAPVPVRALPQAAESPRQEPPKKPRRLPPSPESIFGPRTARVAATAVPLVDGSAADSSDMFAAPAPAPGGLPAIAPIRIAPLSIPPLTIDPLMLGSRPVRK